MANEKGVPIRSLSRGIAVLQAINRSGSLSMMEISRASQVPYPTACRIIETLLHEGLVEREPARKRYRPTGLVQTLSQGYQGQARLVRTARAHIVELTRALGWPISLSTHVGHMMVIRDSTHQLTALTFSEYFPGYSMPILECASGIAYLANLPELDLQHMLATLRLLPEKVSAHELHLVEHGTLLREVRDQGYATRGNNRFTLDPGKTSSIAVPLFDGPGVVGALTLAFFSAATSMREAVATFVPPLQATARAIAAELAIPADTAIDG